MNAAFMWFLCLTVLKIEFTGFLCLYLLLKWSTDFCLFPSLKVVLNMISVSHSETLFAWFLSLSFLWKLCSHNFCVSLLWKWSSPKSYNLICLLWKLFSQRSCVSLLRKLYSPDSWKSMKIMSMNVIIVVRGFLCLSPLSIVHMISVSYCSENDVLMILLSCVSSENCVNTIPVSVSPL